MVISEAKGHDDLCLIMERQEVSDSASFRPRQLFNSRTTASARRRDVGHDQRRPNVRLSLSRVTRHNLLMGKQARTPASTSKTANKSSSGKAGGLLLEKVENLRQGMLQGLRQVLYWLKTRFA